MLGRVAYSNEKAEHWLSTLSTPLSCARQCKRSMFWWNAFSSLPAQVYLPPLVFAHSFFQVLLRACAIPKSDFQPLIRPFPVTIRLA